MGAQTKPRSTGASPVATRGSSLVGCWALKPRSTGTSPVATRGRSLVGCLALKPRFTGTSHLGRAAHSGRGQQQRLVQEPAGFQALQQGREGGVEGRQQDIF